MKTLLKKARACFPWLIAASACTVFLAVLSGLEVNIAPPLPPSLTTAGNSTLPVLPAGRSRSEGWSAVEGLTVNSPIGGLNVLSKSIVSTLELVPAAKKEAKLVAAMIENHEDARPHQQDLKEAIVVFELIVEGDISRFLAFFQVDKLPKTIGPIRSLRPHFVSIARAYNPLLLHAGGSHIAYETLERLGNIVNHDGLRFDGETYERDPDIAPPHNLFMHRTALEGVLAEETTAPQPIPLFTTGKLNGSNAPRARSVLIDFKGPKHNVTFDYKTFAGSYTRSIHNAEKQAKPVNIIVMETFIEGIGQAGYIPWTQTFGGGKALLFAKGRMWKGTWEREKGVPFVLKDAEGNVLPVAKGQTWVIMVPGLERVRWE